MTEQIKCPECGEVMNLIAQKRIKQLENELRAIKAQGVFDLCC